MADEVAMRRDFDDLISELHELQRLRRPAVAEVARRASLWSALEAAIGARNHKRERLMRARSSVRLLRDMIVRGGGAIEAELQAQADALESSDDDDDDGDDGNNENSAVNDGNAPRGRPHASPLTADEQLSIESMCDESTRFAIEALRRAIQREQIIQEHLEDLLEMREESMTKARERRVEAI